MPAIPHRWIPYKPCGQVIEGTRFICFKVPLRRVVQAKHRQIKDIWDIPALLKAVPKLGAVIDLTNTDRYYDPAELKAAGILHRKILMPGRLVPPDDTVAEFNLAVDDFLAVNSEFLIGIHCTHGLNRTGYMVCRYMRDRLGVPAKDAIKKFQMARGYEIEREIFIADLLGLPLPEEDRGSCNPEIRPVVSNGYDHTKIERPPLDKEDEESIKRDRAKRKSRSKHRFGDDRFKNNRNNKKHISSKDRNSKGKDRQRSGSESSNASFDYRFDY